MFFQADDGTYYPLSAVLKFRHSKGGCMEVEVAGQGRVTALEKTLFDAADPQIAAIPAQPGTYVISTLDDTDGDDDLYKLPVIAWGISSTGKAQPITQNGLNDGVPGERVYVLAPDGSVSSTEGYLWKSEAEWREAKPNDRR